jgi:hypothetical protein
LANPSDHDSFKCVINDSGNAFLKWEYFLFFSVLSEFWLK